MGDLEGAFARNHCPQPERRFFFFSLQICAVRINLFYTFSLKKGNRKMTNFETLVDLLEKNAPGAYMAGEMTETGYVEKQFRLGFLHPDVYGWLCLLPTGCKIGCKYGQCD